MRRGKLDFSLNLLTGRLTKGLILCMTTKFTRKSLVYGVPGLLLQKGSLLGFVGMGYTHTDADWLNYLLWAAYLVGTVLLIIGLCEYADNKGQNRVWGVFAGLSLIGLVVLLCLTDKKKRSNLQPSDFDSSLG
jgi:ABC-type multidrug transport system permease subunit